MRRRVAILRNELQKLTDRLWWHRHSCLCGFDNGVHSVHRQECLCHYKLTRRLDSILLTLVSFTSLAAVARPQLLAQSPPQLLAQALASSLAQTSAQAQPAAAASQPWSANLNDIRQIAKMIPGQRPLRINMLKFAESRRTKNFSVQGAPAEPSVQARTVFQVVYRDGYVMIDSGMDEQVHKFFGRGTVEPYFSDASKEVARALQGARSI